MESKDLKKTFGIIAKNNEFTSTLGIWYKESQDCIFTISLQKSNYETLFYVNLKIFIKDIFGIEYKIDKSIKNDTGDIFLRTPKEYNNYFNFEIEIPHDERTEGLRRLFAEFINPFSEKALKKEKIFDLEKEGKILILPAVKEELEKMIV